MPPHKLAEHRRSRGPRYEEEYMKARWKKRDPLPGRGGASLYLETAELDVATPTACELGWAQ